MSTMIICDYEKCTGCMACRNICPKDAVKVKLDSTYKTVPYIDSELCINCNACKNVCPQLNIKAYNSAFKCYAVGAREGADVEFCSSAGVSAAFCEYIIKNGGVAFGAGYGSGKVIHICADSLEEADKLKGSKYVQSDINLIYRDVKAKLKDGTLVLFTGTPCQIAGLHEYLNKDYENLITVDLICHGTPPVKFLEDYLKQCKVSDNWSKITFKQNNEYNFMVYSGDKLVFRSDVTFDPYCRAFYNNIILRNNCFGCKYATAENRPGDISIGDFWGLDKSTLKNPIKGSASVVLINTPKGERFWENVNLPCEEREVLEAVQSNAQLKAPSKYNKDTEVFLKNYHKGFIYAVNKTCVRKNIRTNKINYVKEKIKQVIKKGLRI